MLQFRELVDVACDNIRAPKHKEPTRGIALSALGALTPGQDIARFKSLNFKLAYFGDSQSIRINMKEDKHQHDLWYDEDVNDACSEIYSITHHKTWCVINSDLDLSTDS